MIKHLWRWHPKVALRYLPVVKLIKQSKIDSPKILEIGSGPLGIAPYLQKEITAVDLDFSGPHTSLLTKVKSSALSLPFKKQSFDVVIMMDVLEHLPYEKREKAIREAVRVCKQLLVIGSPCGKQSEAEDLYLSNYYQQIHDQLFPFYQEHLKYHLPSKSWINDTIIKTVEKLKRKMIIKIQGNINLKLHRILMKGWITKNIIIDIIFRKTLLLFIPIMMRMNQEPSYRKLFIVFFKL